jgi:glycerol-3-phosphate dehydrogenase (NAD(P)+)
MSRLGCAAGARAETFAGLSGMGDLIVTCTSRHSRNRSVGERLGRGETVDDILGSMKQVAEGVWNCSSACALAADEDEEAPISQEVRAIVHDGKSPAEAVESLLGRDLKAE